MAVHRRDGHHLVKAKIIELVQFHGGLAHLIAFVHRQNDGFVAAAQHVGHILVRGGQAGFYIHHHDDAVGSVDGDLSLLAHVGQNTLVGGGLNAAGIHQQQLPAAPFAVAENAVAGNAGGILDDGNALAAQFIEQGGFAHVGAAYDRYNGFGHPATLLSFLGLKKPRAPRLGPLCPAAS